MPALAEIRPTATRPQNRGKISRPTCTVCAATMVAAEASALGADQNVVSYLWSCDICGYGFVTDHPISRPASN